MDTVYAQEGAHNAQEAGVTSPKLAADRENPSTFTTGTQISPCLGWRYFQFHQLEWYHRRWWNRKWHNDHRKGSLTFHICCLSPKPRPANVRYTFPLYELHSICSLALSSHCTTLLGDGSIPSTSTNQKRHALHHHAMSLHYTKMAAP